LHKLLEGLKQDQAKSNGSTTGEFGFLGIGLDSCVLPTRHKGVKLVQTTDFFYPLVDDPYMQGKIACANVLSDLYATGVYQCDNLLMLLGVSNELRTNEREIVTRLVIQGFNDLAKEAETTINGGQTVLNPWYIIGGVATSICSDQEFIMPNGGKAGDVLVLTKPLGTQIAVNAHQWIEEPKYWERIQDVVSKEDVVDAYNKAMFSMARLNRNAAKLMQKYQAHGATDVTGFGIIGHATNLVESQLEKVDFIFHTLPIIKNMVDVYKKCGINFKLLDGYSAETSGGLLVCLAKDVANDYIAELKELDGADAWIIGDVVEGERKAKITPDVQIIEV